METRHEKVDAVVVGAGAGGGIVAKQLASAGLKCVILERGQWPDYDDSPNDELINQRTHAIRPLHTLDRRKFSNAEKPWLHDHFLNAACVGSGTVTYGAMAWRFMPQDFKLHTLYPNIKDSALADWPITYDEIEPYYEQAEYEVGVSGDQRENPYAPPRKKDFPMPAFEYNREDREILIPAMKRLGLHPYPIPMLRNSVRYNGRAACLRNHTCCGYICPCDAKNGTQNTVIPVAMRTGNCEVRTGSIACEIVMEGRRAVGVRYFDLDRNSHFQPADAVISAAGSSGTAKLLLMSKSDMFRDGLGNNSDMVGRCANSHHYCGAFGLFDRDVSSEMGPGATVAFSDFNHLPDRKIFAGVLCSEFYTLPWARSRIRPPNSPRWGAEHKRYQRRFRNPHALFAGRQASAHRRPGENNDRRRGIGAAGGGRQNRVEGGRQAESLVLQCRRPAPGGLVQNGGQPEIFRSRPRLQGLGDGKRVHRRRRRARRQRRV